MMKSRESVPARGSRKHTKKMLMDRLQRDEFGPYFKCNKKSSLDFMKGVILEKNVTWKLFVLSSPLS